MQQNRSYQEYVLLGYLGIYFSVVFICVRSVQVLARMSQRQQTMCFSSRLHSLPGNFLLPLTFVIFIIITFVKLNLPETVVGPNNTDTERQTRPLSRALAVAGPDKVLLRYNAG